MKQFQDYLPSVLLFGYAVFSAFIPVTIAHAIILFSLAGLFGFQTHISRLATTKLNQEALDSLKNELDSKISAQKEFYDKKLSKLEDEMAKVQLNTLPSKTVSSSPAPRKVIF
jgi:hypothetical protein